jgi:hypothetical protein
MRVIRRFTVTISIPLLISCSGPATAQQAGRVPQIQPEREVLTVAEDAGFDYIGNLRRAEKKDLDAVIALVNFSPQTDAASALAHGWVLLELQKMIGKDAFAKALSLATEPGRKSTLTIMKVAGTYE